MNLKSLRLLFTKCELTNASMWALSASDSSPNYLLGIRCLVTYNLIRALSNPREPLKRSVRVEGRVERVEPHQSDEYFSSRPFGSQVTVSNPYVLPVEVPPLHSGL